MSYQISEGPWSKGRQNLISLDVPFPMPWRQTKMFTFKYPQCSLRYWYKHVECISSRTSTSFKLRMEIKDNKRITNHNSSSILHWSSCFLFSLSYFLPFNSICILKRCRRLHKIRTTYIMCRESYQSMAPWECHYILVRQTHPIKDIPQMRCTYHPNLQGVILKLFPIQYYIWAL